MRPDDRDVPAGVDDPSGDWMPCPECGAPEGVFLPHDVGLGGTAWCSRCRAALPVGWPG